MEISRRELWEELKKGDVVRLKEIWDYVQLTKDSDPSVLEDGNRKIALITLRFAAAAAYNGVLSEAMGKEIFERMAGKVEFFGFVNAIALAIDVDTTDTRALPIWAKNAAKEEDYKTLAEKIGMLTPDAFANLLAFYITGEVEEVSFEACMPIIKRIYEDENIPNDLLFALMATCLHDTVEHRMAEYIGPYVDVLFAALIGPIFDDREEDGQDNSSPAS